MPLQPIINELSCWMRKRPASWGKNKLINKPSTDAKALFSRTPGQTPNKPATYAKKKNATSHRADQ